MNGRSTKAGVELQIIVTGGDDFINAGKIKNSGGVTLVEEAEGVI
jgi:hypothetical protein